VFGDLVADSVGKDHAAVLPFGSTPFLLLFSLSTVPIT